MKLEQAQTIAGRIIEKLSPNCIRIEPAGSVRRLKPEVGDIEIVAIPKPGMDLFGEPVWKNTKLDAAALKLGKEIKGGEKYKQIRLPDGNGINLDLFIVTPPAQWGVQFAIRTGDRFFSHWMVTNNNLTAHSERSGEDFKGALPAWARVEHGAVWEGNRLIAMPEEIDFFKYCGLDYIAPQDRHELTIAEITSKRQ